MQELRIHVTELAIAAGADCPKLWLQQQTEAALEGLQLCKRQAVQADSGKAIVHTHSTLSSSTVSCCSIARLAACT